MITLTGLTSKQVVLCDIMWKLSCSELVDDFVNTLPLEDAQECRSLIELMIMEISDQVESVDDACSILDQFKLPGL